MCVCVSHGKQPHKVNQTQQQNYFEFPCITNENIPSVFCLVCYAVLHVLFFLSSLTELPVSLTMTSIMGFSFPTPVELQYMVTSDHMPD